GTRNETINVVNIDRGSVVGTTGNLSIARATMIGGTIDSGTGTVTLASNVTFGNNNNAGDSTAHSIEVQPSSMVATIGGPLAGSGNLSLAIGVRKFVVSGPNCCNKVYGHNLYYMMN